MAILKYIIIIGMASSIISCNNIPVTSTDQVAIEMTYDSLRAQALGADDYGKAQYVMAFLYKGESDVDPVVKADLTEKHMININRLAEEGQLALAGPFLDDGDLRGIYVLNVATVEDAEALVNTDPAIQQGLFRIELHPWYGSAAVKEINDTHNIIAKRKM